MYLVNTSELVMRNGNKIPSDKETHLPVIGRLETLIFGMRVSSITLMRDIETLCGACANPLALEPSDVGWDHPFGVI